MFFVLVFFNKKYLVAWVVCSNFATEIKRQSINN